MENKILIAPSILSANFAIMGEEVKNLEKCGADLIHCDVMDGEFVPNITFGSKMIKDIRPLTNLPLDAHLMVDRPERYIEDFVKAGSDYITVHFEATKNLKQVLNQIKSYNVKCGAVINPHTPVSSIKDVVELCDMVLLMSVQPGFGGQKYIESVTPKIAELRQIIDSTGKDILLEIDGGITLENVNIAKGAGANVIVAGNTIFSHNDRSESIAQLRKL